jgi:hypothetical protein
MRLLIIAVGLTVPTLGCRLPPDEGRPEYGHFTPEEQQWDGQPDVDNVLARISLLRPGMKHDEVLATLGMEGQNPGGGAGSLSRQTWVYDLSYEHISFLNYGEGDKFISASVVTKKQTPSEQRKPKDWPPASSYPPLPTL